MNILVIKLSPLRGISSSMMRTVGLVKGLVQLGHQVDLLTIPAGGQLMAIRSDSPLPDTPCINLLNTSENIIYTKIVSRNDSGLKRYLVNWLRKAYHVVNLYDNTIRLAKSINRNGLKDSYDLVISVSDPKSGHMAVKCLKAQGLRADRWVQYWGDPMTLDITNKAVLPRFLYRREERKLLSGCDKVFYTNPFTLEQQRALFPEFANKMASTPTALSKELICVRSPGSPFRISYIGAYHSRVRNIIPFYQAALSLGEGTETYIVGDSDHVLAESDNVHVLPRGEVKEIECGTDLFICVLNYTGTQIPGKVYHYAASNRPILVILDGEYKDRIQYYLSSFDRYLFCENTISSIVAAVNEAIHSQRKWAPSECFKPSIVAKKFLV